MNRLTGRRALGYGLFGGCAGLLCDLTWSRAAAADHRCYDYGLRLLADPSNDEGWCYSFGTRATLAAFMAVAVSTLLAAGGVWIATNRFVTRDRWAASSAAAVIALIGMVGVVRLEPFEFRFIPSTPPIWLPVAVMIVAFGVGALAGAEATQRIAALSALTLVAAMGVVVVPIGAALQHRQDRRNLAELQVALLVPNLPKWHIDHVVFDPLSPTASLNIRLVPDGQDSGSDGGLPATAKATPNALPSAEATALTPSSDTAVKWIAVHLYRDASTPPSLAGQPITRCASINGTCWPEVDVRFGATSVTLSAVGSSTSLETLLLAAHSLLDDTPADLARHVCAC